MPSNNNGRAILCTASDVVSFTPGKTANLGVGADVTGATVVRFVGAAFSSILLVGDAVLTPGDAVTAGAFVAGDFVTGARLIGETAMGRDSFL